MTLLNKATFVCLDCEFTGLNFEEDCIIEVAAIRFSIEHDLDEFETLLDPEHPISSAEHLVGGAI